MTNHAVPSPTETKISISPLYFAVVATFFPYLHLCGVTNSFLMSHTHLKGANICYITMNLQEQQKSIIVHLVAVLAFSISCTFKIVLFTISTRTAVTNSSVTPESCATHLFLSPMLEAILSKISLFYNYSEMVAF